MGRGGHRPGAGRPKGAKGTKTLQKEEARDLLRQQVLAHLGPMVQAQIAHATGIGHLYIRSARGTLTKVVSQRQAAALLSGGIEGQTYWIFTKDPSVQAFTDLMNRALDKPAEHAPQGNDGVDWDKLVARLKSARNRGKQ